MKAFVIVIVFFAAIIACVVIGSVEFGARQTSGSHLLPAPASYALPPAPLPRRDACAPSSEEKPKEQTTSKKPEPQTPTDDQEDKAPKAYATLHQEKVERVIVIKEVQRTIIVNNPAPRTETVTCVPAESQPAYVQPAYQRDLCSQFTGLAQDRCRQYLPATRGRCDRYDGTSNLYPCLKHYGGDPWRS